jgi:hypothetical protein
MKRVIVAAVMLLDAGVGQAIAASTCTAGPFLTQSQISSVVNNNFACVFPLAPGGNDEQHVSGRIMEFGKGPTTTDIGGYVISTSGTDGVITYNYTNGPSFSYKLNVLNNGADGKFGNLFCQISPGTVALAVTVQSGHC